jgi:hypothetical protein
MTGDQKDVLKEFNEVFNEMERNEDSSGFPSMMAALRRDIGPERRDSSGEARSTHGKGQAHRDIDEKVKELGGERPSIQDWRAFIELLVKQEHWPHKDLKTLDQIYEILEEHWNERGIKEIIFDFIEKRHRRRGKTK